MKAASKFIKRNLHWFIVGGVTILCALFIIFGHTSENGQYRTLDGNDAQIPEATTKFIEDAEDAMYRIMNEDAPTDETTVEEYKDGFEDDEGLGGSTTLDTVIARRKPDGDNDGGRGWQCSKYTAYLATGKKDYSSAHPDYGPVNGKNVAAWLHDNFGWKYVDTPVKGAIGSGGFNTLYGHTAMFLYWVGTNVAMVNDANYTPLTVSTHTMNTSGWVWVVPPDYTPDPEPTPTPTPTPAPTPTPSEDVSYTVRLGDTLGAIIRANGYTGNRLFGDDGLAQAIAEKNGIANRGLIYPNQTIILYRSLMNAY